MPDILRHRHISPRYHHRPWRCNHLRALTAQARENRQDRYWLRWFSWREGTLNHQCYWLMVPLAPPTHPHPSARIPAPTAPRIST